LTLSTYFADQAGQKPKIPFGALEPPTAASKSTSKRPSTEPETQRYIEIISLDTQEQQEQEQEQEISIRLMKKDLAKR
jgi:hypothetical protein